MKILLVGTGAVGVYFGGRLAQNGNDVTAVVRSDFEFIREHGYRIHSEKGDFSVQFPCLANASEYPGVPDLIIYAAKALPGIDGPGMIRGAVKSPATRIMLIQNGIGIEDDFRREFPDNELFSTVAYIGATRTAPGEVEQKGAARLIFGRDGGGDSEFGHAIMNRFREAHVECEFVPQVAVYRWQKLLWNVPFNPLSVLGGGLLTDQMVSGAVGELARKLMREVIAVARSQGVELDDSLVEKNMEFTRDFPPYKTSMLIDFEHGRELEVDAIVNRVVGLARQAGVAVPHCETVGALLAARDRQNRKEKSGCVS